MGEAVEAARGWVRDRVAENPTAVCVYLGGSLNRVHPDAPMPASSDVDIHVIQATRGSWWADGPHRRLLLGCSVHDIDLSSPTAVLARPFESHPLLFGTVLADPRGALAAARRAAVPAFAEPLWIRARCGAAVDLREAGRGTCASVCSARSGCGASGPPAWRTCTARALTSSTAPSPCTARASRATTSVGADVVQDEDDPVQAEELPEVPREEPGHRSRRVRAQVAPAGEVQERAEPPGPHAAVDVLRRLALAVEEDHRWGRGSGSSGPDTRAGRRRRRRSRPRPAARRAAARTRPRRRARGSR